jgi:hydroxymethylbilane synthase
MLIIGSRGSPLALWQARRVQALLAGKGVDARIEVIKTTGDRNQEALISSIGTKAIFTKEIEDALLAGSVDLAVHSLKDLTTELPGGLCLAATPEREDAHDAIAGKPLAEAVVVGTSSARRATQLRALRPDLDIRPSRGNIDTRLRKLDEGQFDSIVLAAAGLRRLGLQRRITEELSYDDMVPAPGQGALGIETCIHGAGLEAARLLNDTEIWNAITAERAVLEALGGGCQVPIGAFARVFAKTIRLRAMIAHDDGTIARASAEGHVDNAREFGLEVGARLRK